jgi:hypothetical protein
MATVLITIINILFNEFTLSQLLYNNVLRLLSIKIKQINW